MHSQRSLRRRCVAVLVRLYLVERDIRRRVAEGLAIDPRASVDRVLERLEDQGAGALARHKAIAIAVEGAASLLGRVVARRRGADRVVGSDPHLAQRSLVAVGGLDVRVAAMVDPRRFDSSTW